MIKIWSDLAWNDYLEFFNKHQKDLIKNTHELIKDIERNGTDKVNGQPEQLKHELTGFYSRRIDQKNRLIYKVEAENLVIVQCGTHYQQ